MKRKAFIFDLDGTIALTDHRNHIIAATDIPNKWEKFYALCYLDAPNWPVIKVLNALYLQGYVILIWSGRSDQVKVMTESWLRRHMPDTVVQLKMRPAHDHRHDSVLKGEWYDALLKDDTLEVIGVFEDRTRMVEMWRKLGLVCFQNAKGDF